MRKTFLFCPALTDLPAWRARPPAKSSRCSRLRKPSKVRNSKNAVANLKQRFAACFGRSALRDVQASEYGPGPRDSVDLDQLVRMRRQPRGAHCCAAGGDSECMCCPSAGAGCCRQRAQPRGWCFEQLETKGRRWCGSVAGGRCKEIAELAVAVPVCCACARCKCDVNFARSKSSHLLVRLCTLLIESLDDFFLIIGEDRLQKHGARRQLNEGVETTKVQARATKQYLVRLVLH
jgi:hypothetical protein